jgi:hypothetical protein
VKDSRIKDLQAELEAAKAAQLADAEASSAELTATN